MGLTVWLAAGCASTAPPPGGAVSGAGSASGYTVSGRVLGEPGCPGPEREGTPCPPELMAGASVRVEQGTRVITRATADATGSFELRVAAGRYTITATAPGPLSSEQTRDLVVAGPVTVDLTVDTGLR